MKKTSMVVAAALVGALATPSTFAADTTEALRAVRDKETGEIRAPNKEEMKGLIDAEKAERKARGLPDQAAESRPIQVRTYASGMKAAVLGEDFLVSVEAHRDTNNNLVMKHADPADEHVAAPTTELPME